MNNEKIKIGTLIKARNYTPDYIKQILPNGFESFSIIFTNTLGDHNLKKMADDCRDLLAQSNVVISCLSIFGNPLMDRPIDAETRDAWTQLIDCAELFGCDLVTGFTGRLIDKPIDQSIDRFAQVFEPLALRAADRGVRLAFENCAMGGNWQTGDWNIAHNPTAWQMMFNALPAENIGLQWEPCHQMASLIDPMPQLQQWVKKIFHLHGKDANILWDVIHQHGINSPHKFILDRFPGFGDSNWADIISQLRIGGFQGSIDIEGWHDSAFKGEQEIPGQVHALNYLKKCRRLNPPFSGTNS